ncbi:helix-turn-helix transcriptional regulator [Paraburkholderia sp. J67]|uniref:helix-turn-helix transcriptional regulator n=1 Tax=Paraburkholderia sp. J67 TaxID=2805435 RepID=UPI002ABD7DD4|nr:helix-turn-helix transcriptional regulator [Paraburkholderia sp. J67]
MPVNTLTPPLTEPVDSLGGFLRERRERLAPGPDASARRRTPGLRREEVAARAHVSVAWYTWLEQGRGGPPSAEVLERLARALELDDAGREMLFLLGQQRPPPLTPNADATSVPALLQSVLDGQPNSPAIIKTPTWDVVAWNEAASAVLGDYGAVPAHARNVLRRLFGDDPHMRAMLPDWEDNARWAVSVFRIDVARGGGAPQAQALVAELLAQSEDFRRIWAESEVRRHGIGTKRLVHSEAGPLALSYSSFGVDGSNGLSMIVFSPATAHDARAIETLIARRRAANEQG